MKVAVSANGRDLDAPIDPRFGRCAYFIIVDTDDMSFEAFDNESIASGGGAGIESARLVASKGAKAVVSGNVGLNAVRALSAAGIEIYLANTGTAREVIEKHKRGYLALMQLANVPEHRGSVGRTVNGRGAGMGRRKDAGRSMGMGSGRGK